VADDRSVALLFAVRAGVRLCWAALPVLVGRILPAAVAWPLGPGLVCLGVRIRGQLRCLRLLHRLRWRRSPPLLLFLDEDIVDCIFIVASHLGAFLLSRESEHVFQCDLVVVEVENLFSEFVRFAALEEEEEKPVFAC
jgi:hypothetical protein